MDEDAIAEARRIAESAEVSADSAGRLLWLAVGQSLKRIDRTLAVPFTRWSRPVASSAECEQAWGRMERGGGGGGGMLSAGGGSSGNNGGTSGTGLVTPEQQEAIEFLRKVSRPGRRALGLAVRAVVATPPAAPLLTRAPRLEPAPLPLALAAGRTWSSPASDASSSAGIPLLPWLDGMSGAGNRNRLMESDGAGLFPSYSASLHLAWGLPRGSPPESFYVLESCGSSGSKQQRSADWRAVVTDPPSARGWTGGTGTQGTAARGLPAGGVVLRGLPPGKEFHFRLRALNAHGASPYHAIVATTCPAPPPRPIVSRTGATSLKLEWGPYAAQRRVADAVRGHWLCEARRDLAARQALADAGYRAGRVTRGRAALENGGGDGNANSGGNWDVRGSSGSSSGAVPFLKSLPADQCPSGDSVLLASARVPAGRLLSALRMDRHMHADVAAMAAAQPGADDAATAAAAAEEAAALAGLREDGSNGDGDGDGDRGEGASSGCVFVQLARRRVPVISWSDLPWSGPGRSLAVSGGDGAREIAARARDGVARHLGEGLVGLARWLQAVGADAEGARGRGTGRRLRSGSGANKKDGALNSGDIGAENSDGDIDDDDDEEDDAGIGSPEVDRTAVGWAEVAAHAAHILGVPLDMLSPGNAHSTGAPSALALAGGFGNENIGGAVLAAAHKVDAETDQSVAGHAQFESDSEARRHRQAEFGPGAGPGADPGPSAGTGEWSLSTSSKSTARGSRPHSARSAHSAGGHS